VSGRRVPVFGLHDAGVEGVRVSLQPPTKSRCAYCGSGDAPLADKHGAACVRCAYAIDVLREPLVAALDEEDPS
jgi:hypothetical protein